MSNEKKSKNWIKHLVKDPVYTMEEANKRTKELIIPTIICAGLAVGFVVLSNVIPSLQSLFMLLGVAAVILFFGCILLFVVIKKLKRKFTDLECPNCHSRIEYSDAVKIISDKRTLKINTTTKQNSTAGVDLKVEGIETALVTIRCKCQKCGTEKEFTTTLKTIQCVRSENCSALELGARRNQFENDLREEAKNGFDGSRGYRYISRHDIDSVVAGYFGDIVQI